MVSDFLHAGLSMPTVPFQKDMQLAELAAARECANPRPSWCSVFTKAYGKVVAAQPTLRRACLTFPTERLIEYPVTTADIVIESQHEREDVLVNLFLTEPAAMSLAEIDQRIAALKAKPHEGSVRLRIGMRVARLPRLLRRFGWWCTMHVSASLRGRLFATYAVSSVANWGVDSLRPISTWTTLLHYGVVDAEGKVAVRLTFDHRIMDGGPPSFALNEMERILKTEILTEVLALQDAAPKAT